MDASISQTRQRKTKKLAELSVDGFKTNLSTNNLEMIMIQIIAIIVLIIIAAFIIKVLGPRELFGEAFMGCLFIPLVVLFWGGIIAGVIVLIAAAFGAFK